MLARFVPVLLVLVPLLAVVGCENDLLEPELTGAIEGQVLDFDTRAPLSGVGITTNPPTGALVTDDEGRFRLDELPAGNYSVAGRLAGYDPNSVTVSVRDGDVTSAVLFLEEETEEDTTETAADFEASVLGFTNQFQNDTTSVIVEYRARNVGEVAIPVYELYFQILTTGQTYFAEVNGTDLGVGQADIGSLEKFVGRDTVTAVQISDTYFEGQ
jgi:hypothetical protein